ncbi:MAG TPA: T9SS type A sorting domain-containing protein, partial [Adhaeribacter sp.]|nr:T9SS type A sorting domain-containing protein [Adhaeribacter sp.]
MIFRLNATYISRHGASPFGLASPNAKVVFETGSLYRHEQTGTAPRFDGRTYADFELNVASNLAIIFGTSALSPNRIDNFTISSGNMNITLSNGTNPLPLQITGNLSVAPGALLNYNPSSTANASTLTLAGTKQQTVSGPVYLGPYATLEINNPAGVVLETALNINGGLQLSNGVLTVPAGTELNLEDNAVVSGGSAGSYVNGKMIKTGDDAFVFPVGKSGLYAPVAISAPVAVTDKFSAEYFPVNPTTIFGTAKNDSLAQISATEYWTIDRLAGTSEVKVSLSYDAARSLAVANPADLRIAHFKDNGWSNEGKAEILTEPQYLLVATSQPQASFSPFTFASVTTNNPLPVELLCFNARKTGATVQLTWETASEMNSDRFEIERSQDGRTFETIGSVKAAGHSNTVKRYAFEDKNPNSGLNYYRLKQADLDGSFAYSKVVSVTAVKKEIAVSLYPNPARDVLIVSLPTNAAETTIQVYNAVGQEVRTLKTNAAAAQLNVVNLPAGIYQVRIVNANGM